MNINLPVDAHIYSIQVFPSEIVAPGQMIRFGREMHSHPLDIIAIKHPGDPLGRLDAAMGWLLDRAMGRLTQVERAL